MPNIKERKEKMKAYSNPLLSLSGLLETLSYVVVVVVVVVKTNLSFPPWGTWLSVSHPCRRKPVGVFSIQKK